MGLCLTCLGINIESLSQASGYQHLDLGNLRRSREICRMCDFLYKAFEDSYCLFGRFDITDIWNDTWSLDMQLTEGVRPNLRLTVSNATGTSGVEDLLVHTDDLDPATLTGLCPHLSLPSSTNSHESYATARKWIGECASGHPHISESGDTEIQQLEVSHFDIRDRPRRLVHVQSRGSGLLLRLVDPLSIGHAYATLSHCVSNLVSLH
jgi:hypothetical protein